MLRRRLWRVLGLNALLKKGEETVTPTVRQCVIDSVIATSCFYHVFKQQNETLANKVMDDALGEFAWFAEVKTRNELKEVISMLEEAFPGYMEDRPLSEILDVMRGNLALREIRDL
jgi:hypothetical protein